MSILIRDISSISFFSFMTIHRIKKSKNSNARAECAPLLSAVEGKSTPAIVCVCDSIVEALNGNVGLEQGVRRGVDWCG